MDDSLIDLIVSDDVSVGLRRLKDSDESFIYDSWIRSYSTSPANKLIKWPQYQRYQKFIITRLLERSDVLVLCSEDDTDHILGYIIVEPTLERLALHWIFIKYPFRKFGLARWLLDYIKSHWSDGRELTISHISANKFSEYLTEKHEFIYDPLTKEEL